MTQTSSNPDVLAGGGPRAAPVPEHLLPSAAERLVSGPDRARAARLLIANAPAHGIDLGLLWGVEGGPPASRFIRQVVMGVPSAGRTGMLFLSAPREERRFGTPDRQAEELAACLRAANAELAVHPSHSIHLTQALIEPEHAWGERACRDAGMTWVGRLRFLKRRWRATNPEFEAVTDWPDRVSIGRVIDPTDFGPHGSGRALEQALDGSYEHTLDCPELCGLRSTQDVIASHMATGVFDPNRWWLLRVNGQPEGCCLLNHCPSTSSVELVYLGLSPRARGAGLGARLLRHALAHLDVQGVREITCAVDTRNSPALKLYGAFGFSMFSARIGFVHTPSTRIVEPKPLTAQQNLPGAALESKPDIDAVQSTSGGHAGTSRGQENLDGPKRL